MEQIKVKIYSETGNIPEYKTKGSAGIDLPAYVKPNHKGYIDKETIKNIIEQCKFEAAETVYRIDIPNELNYKLSNFIKELYGNSMYMPIEITKAIAVIAKIIEATYKDNKPIPEEGIIVIPPYWSGIIPTGIRMEIPEGYELQIRPRSGINAKTLLSIKFGTVDSDYRGDIGIVVQNKSIIPVIVEQGDRLAQGVFNAIKQADFSVVETPEELEATERGEGGFGSTGIK